MKANNRAKRAKAAKKRKANKSGGHSLGAVIMLVMMLGLGAFAIGYALKATLERSERQYAYRQLQEQNAALYQQARYWKQKKRTMHVVAYPDEKYGYEGFSIAEVAREANRLRPVKGVPEELPARGE